MAKNINQQKVDFATGYPSYMVQNIDMEFTKEWAMNFVQRAYGNRQYIVQLDNLKKFRDLDRGLIDVNVLKNNFDKQGKDNPQGGGDEGRAEKAAYVNSDMRPCPLYQSLNQITKGYILDQLAEVQVNGLDRISHEKKIKERQKNAVKRYAIDYLNFIGSLTHDAPLPYNTNLSKLADGNSESSDLGEGVSMIDQIKTELDDDPSFALLSEIGALKDGVEAAHETMIKFFMKNGNFNDIIGDKIVRDIMHVRAFCYRVYTSAKDGTFKYHYCDLSTLNVSPFKLKDGSDIDYIFEEFTVTWGEFMEMVGAKLEQEHLMKIYIANRDGYGLRNTNTLEWNRDTVMDSGFYNSLNNTAIKLGYFELKKQIHDPNNDKYYTVTKKFYCLPIFGQGYMLKSEDIVFDLGDLQDMSRFGGMLEQSKYSYVIHRDNSYQSWYEIQESNLMLLNTLYNQYQNTVNGIVPRGLFYAEETLRELVEDMIRAKEEHLRETGREIGNMDGEFQQLLRNVIKRTEQSGKGIFKRRTGDNNEKSLDPPTFSIEHHLYEDLAQLMQQIMSVYNMMIMSLGTNPQMLGQAPRPRQAVSGLELSSKSGLTMLDDMVSMYNFSLRELGSRAIYYNQQVIKEFNSKLEPTSQRAEQMRGVIGDLGVNWLEIYNDMPQQKCGIIIQASPTAEDRLMIFQYTSQLELQGRVPIGTAFMTKEISNPKLAYLWMMAAVKRQERQMVENQMQAMQLQQQQAQQAQGQAVQTQDYFLKQEAQMKAQITALEAQLKEQGMSKNIEERGVNKEKENQQKADLEMQKATHEKEINSL